MTRDWTPSDAADAADDARARKAWRASAMPIDGDTDQPCCPGCMDPCDDPDVEAFEVTGELVCRECAAERLADVND